MKIESFYSYVRVVFTGAFKLSKYCLYSLKFILRICSFVGSRISGSIIIFSGGTEGDAGETVGNADGTIGDAGG
jgi:hypothetical protein